jgi:1,4-alpha-glucan branching enzyme
MSKPGDFDLQQISEGNCDRLYEKLGAQIGSDDGVSGTHFGVWAPGAREISVVGDFNAWRPGVNALVRRGSSGVWTGFVPGVGQGAQYKYSIVAADGRPRYDKADPLAFAAELPPGSASKVWDLSSYPWGDAEWIAQRPGRHSLTAPIAIYELHVGSWMRVPEQSNRPLYYRELALRLADHVAELGFTHVELMPICEYPASKSWGYQVVSYYAPSSRFGTPQDLMFLVDTLHQRGIGVILDWVPAHFASDSHGLCEFDGTHLYEPADESRRKFPIWNTYAFDYETPPVVNFLVGSALFWLDRYHFDGLRVDGVEAMTRLGFSRKAGEWRPNKFGGDENLEAIAFLERLNRKVHERFPGALTFAEDATARPHVTRPVQFGGLGFDLKWDMGWTFDTVNHYMVLEEPKRKGAHSKLTFRMHYAFNENYLLPVSHDEVVPGKGSLLGRMPGDEWKKRANLRLLYGYMYTLPGKKLLFMGDEIGQWQEWSHTTSIDWHLLSDARHSGIQRWVRDLNTCYRAEPVLHELDCRADGFFWLDANNAAQGVLSYFRRGTRSGEIALVVCNFTATVYQNFRLGVPERGRWDEILNSDAKLYGGSGQGNMGSVTTAPIGAHGHLQSVNLTIPPLAVLVLRQSRG